MRGRAPGAAILAGVVVMAGCGPTPPSTTTSSSPPVSPVSPSTSDAPSSRTASPSAAAGAVAVDAGLLEILPADIDGQPLRPDPDTAAEIAGDEDLALEIEAIAVGLYVRPGSSTEAEGLAIVNVVRLRPGVFDEAWFRSWRTTYDQGACQVAGGVTPGAAETRIGDHATHIGTCDGGVHTYHVHVVSPDRVVSITGAGQGRVGERVVAGLTE